MRNSLSFLFCLIISSSFAQNVDYMDHNNTRATLPRIGNFFTDNVNSTPGYEVPEASGNHTMFEARFYYMGLDANNALHASWGGDPNMGTDVFSGPYSANFNYDSTYQNLWSNRSWQICQEEIDIYKAWWEACEGPNQDPQDCATVTVPSNATLTKIYQWPAHGDVSNGEAYYLAPFWDMNSNATYDPSEGDYPLIKGCCATFRIENDAAGVHTFSGGEPMGIEMHYLTYQYKNFGLLNDVTFVEVAIHNRGTNTYPEFSYGMYADSQIGDWSDDFMGSDSLRSLYYTYNADNSDAAYGVNPPAFGIMGLEDSLNSVVQYNGSNTLAEVWYLMNGLDQLGQPIMDLQSAPTKFQFNENPNLVVGYSEASMGNTPADRRAMLSNNNGVFAPGDVIKQTYALVYVREGGDNLQNVDALYAAADEVHAFYDTIANAQCEGGFLSLQQAEEQLELRMVPNPASNKVTIATDVEGAVQVQLLDMSGKSILAAEGIKKVDLDVSGIENGAYLVYVTTQSGRVTKKLLVSH